jgi:hypothetical protein
MLALLLAPVIVMVKPGPPPSHPCPLPQAVHTSHDPAPPIVVHKLGDLPDADMDLAVLRTVDGCAMRQVVRFHVSDPSPGGAEAGVQLPGIKGTLVPQGQANQRAQPVR